MRTIACDRSHRFIFTACALKANKLGSATFAAKYGRSKQ